MVTENGDSSHYAGELPEVLRIFLDSSLDELTLDVGELHLHVRRTSSEDDRGRPASDAAHTVALDADPRDAARPSHAADIAVDAASGSATVQEPDAPVSSANGADLGPAIDPVEQGAENYTVTSPTTGIFHRRPAPTSEPYVQVGSKLSTGDVVCIVEVMKMFSEVAVDFDGVVTDILVEDGSLVEEGQVLMVVGGSQAGST